MSDKAQHPHPPTPWTRDLGRILDADGGTVLIAFAPHEIGRAEIEIPLLDLIVRSVNVHAELVAALRDAQQRLRHTAAMIANSIPILSTNLHIAADEAHAAIAKAAE